MKYIITEQQNERLQKIIWRYLNSHLTPYEGWRNRNDYAREADVDGEIFLHLVEEDNGIESFGDEPHMWYSVCDNHNLDEPIPEGECPVVTIPSSKSEALYGFFGDRWKPVFLEWFNSKTGLPIIKVDTQDWG